MTETEGARGNQEGPAYGWVMVVLAALYMGVGSGSLGAVGVFLKPLSDDFGWLRGDTAFAYLAGSLGMGVGGIGMGYLSDRFSARPIVIFGTLVLGGCFLLLSRIDQLWQLYLWYILLGVFGAGSFDSPLLTNVGAWFTRRKGLALGVTTAGRSLGQGFVPFIAGVLIVQSGWRVSYLDIALFVLLFMLPLTLLIRQPPLAKASAEGTAKGAAPSDVIAGFPLKNATFVAWLGTAAIFCCITMATPMVNVVALAQDLGLGLEHASGILLVIFLVGFFGRIIFGALADHIGGLRSYFLSSAIQSVFVFGFIQVESIAGFYVLAALFGFGFSGVMTSMVISVREMVPFSIRGTSQGIVMFMAWIGMGLGGWQGGFFFDLTGAYAVSFGNAALMGVINLGLLGGLIWYLKAKGFGMKVALASA